MPHECVQLAVLRHTAGQGALASAMADDQCAHAASLGTAGAGARGRRRLTAMALIHTCYRITDIDRSVAFYEALGFEEMGRLPIKDEAVNVFMNQPGDGDMPRLELTYNFGVDSYDIGTGY